MAMSAFRKNKISVVQWMLALILGGVGVLPANAEIVLQYGVPGYTLGFTNEGRRMPTIFIAPPASWSQASYLTQRSRAWYSYGRQGSGSGLPLVITPMGMSGDVSARQIRVRNHVAQANAYRLRYYDR